MNQARVTRPKYAESFRCIGSSCEDLCCEGWGVPVSKADWERFQSMPEGPVKTKMLAAVELAPAGATENDGFGPNPFGRILMNSESKRCSLLSSEGLCRVHSECGSEYLCYTCASYPRVQRNQGGFEERSLALSCPEAARHVLLDPHLPMATSRFVVGAEAPSLPPHFWEIRERVVALVRNRAYPLWKRLFLLGVLSRRIDEANEGRIRRSVPQVLADFQATVGAGRLNTVMEAEPVDRRAQLDAVLRLAGLMLNRSYVRGRFVECINNFASGIGNGPQATLDSLTDGYTEAHDRYFAPYFDRRPHILENWLLNTIIRQQFPFGSDGMKPGGTINMTREFVRLTAQFALIKGLLIGAAGHYREQFSTDHLVLTVQASSKHFDHHPEFPRFAHELLTELRLDGARGMSVLLRNAEPAVSRREVPLAAVPGLWTETGAGVQTGASLH